jgi:septal ring factor EnvC (AmiA/AmiB activator)
MEGCKDVSKSVTSHPLSHPTQESDVRTEWSVLDRTGMAARFLRLAFRINQEQLKLAEAAPVPRPEPLSEEEIAEQETLAAEERAEIAAVRQRGEQELNATQVSLMDQLQAARHEAAEARREAAAAREELERRFLTPSGTSSGEEAGAADHSAPSEGVDCDAAPSRREGATLKL